MKHVLLVLGIATCAMIAWLLAIVYKDLTRARYNTSLWDECEQVFKIEVDRGRALALDANGDLETRQVIARKKIKLCTMI